MGENTGGWKVMLRPITPACLSLDFNWMDSLAKLDLRRTFRNATTVLVRSFSTQLDRQTAHIHIHTYIHSYIHTLHKYIYTHIHYVYT
jgi:hypothetical protein